MEPAKVDRRVKYTKLMLKDNLIEILEQEEELDFVIMSHPC